MRASYVNGPELLTPLGEWIAARMPHVQRGTFHQGLKVFRIYGCAPLYRRCLLDWTRVRSWSRIRVLGWTIYERNHQFSGLPGAKRI